MEDVSDIFKRHFNLLHKGTAIPKTVQDRKEELRINRKAKRDTLASIRRNIENLSPINTPTPTKCGPGKIKNIEKTNNVPEKQADCSIKPKQGEVSTRYELLQKWKAEKAKMKAVEKAKTKPIFKVYHVSSDITAELENANKVIKGKPIVPGSANHKSQFAPPNHKFKPPSGLLQSQSTVFASTKTSRSLRSTPQASARNDSVIKKLVSGPSQGSSKQEPGISRYTFTRNAEASKSKIDIKKNAKEIVKSQVNKFNKDKENGLIEEVKKKTASTSDKTKANKHVKTNLESKKTSTSGTTLKQGTPIPTRPVTRNSKKAAEEKLTNAKVIDQKTPKKAVGWSVKKSDQNKRPSDSDSNGKITFRKTPKKSKVLTESGQRELVIINKKSSVTASLEGSTKGSPTKITMDSTTLPQNEDNLPTADDDQLAAKPIQSNAVGSSSSMSTDYSVDYDNCSNAPLSSVPADFDYNKSPPIYISPFVTISRGKNSARKEYNIRKSLGTCEIDKDTPEVKKILSAHTSPKAGAVYFKRKLDAEIKRINGMCDDWETYLKHPNLPEEAYSTIDVAIGQSRLLVSKKFQQFLGLISQCETENYETKPVTCDDLHGFWDMLYIQVGDVDKRFANLQRLRDNNWEEILPQKVVPVKRARGRPKKAPAKSKLMQMINEARKKKQDQQPENVDLINGLEYARILQTPPGKKLVEESSSTKRRSCRVSLLKENNTRCSSSPGLTMMKVTQSIKRGDGLTPARSILKTDVFIKSTGKKSVVFKDVKESPKILCKAKLFQEEEKENVSDSLINFNASTLTPRRSIRISQLKM